MKYYDRILFELIYPDGRHIKIYYDGHVEGIEEDYAICNWAPNLVQQAVAEIHSDCGD